MNRLMILVAVAMLSIIVSCNKSELDVFNGGSSGNMATVQVSLRPDDMMAAISSPASSKTAQTSTSGMNVTYGEVNSKSVTHDDATENTIHSVHVIQYRNDIRVGSVEHYPITGTGTEFSLNITIDPSPDATTLYFIANVDKGDIMDKNTGTISALKGLHTNIVAEIKPTPESGMPMLGTFTGIVSAESKISSVNMKRLLSKVILKCKVDPTFATKRSFALTNVRLHNVANKIYYGVNKTPGAAVVWPDAGAGNYIAYPLEDITAGTDGGNGYTQFVWYVPENLCGTDGSIEHLFNRTPDKIDSKGTYIEILGETDDNKRIKYKFALGNVDISKGGDLGNYDVEHNKSYTVYVEITGINEADSRIEIEDLPNAPQEENSAMIVPASGIPGGVSFNLERIKSGWYEASPTENLIPDLDKMRAEILWMDTENLIGNANIKLEEVGAAKIKCLTVNSTENIHGNAVIAVYDEPVTGGEILWSWHVWVTSYDPVIPTDDAGAVTAWTGWKADKAFILENGTGQVHSYSGAIWDGANNGKVMMDRDLGAAAGFTSAPKTADNPMSAWGLFYQWGRKDPQPRGSTGAPLYGALSAIPAASDPVTTVGASVKIPATFIKGIEALNWDWLNGPNQTEIKDKLWGIAKARDVVYAAKSPYDPCPKGWRVPINGTWDNFVGDTDTSQDKFQYMFEGELWVSNGLGDNGAPTNGHHHTHGRLYKPTAGGATVATWYPASGYREYKSGTQGNTSSLGFIWSSSAVSTHSYASYYRVTVIFPNNPYQRAWGFKVRCLQDQ